MELSPIQIEALQRLIRHTFDDEHRHYHESDSPRGHIFEAIDCLDTALIEAGYSINE